VAVTDVTALVRSSDVRDVGRDRVLADFDRRAVEADVRDVVLPTAVGAATHLDVDPAGQLVVELHLLQTLRDRLIETHRARDSKLARIRAGAADDIGDLVRSGVAEPQLAEALPHLVDSLIADPPEDQVLVDGRPGVSAAVLAHHLSKTAELVRRQVAARNLDLHRREAVLAL